MENEFQDEEPKLNGAFISSLIVGAIIVIMWVAVYVLYQAS
ncbi:cytochrome C oxidase subunit II [Allobacillus halotolerans]|uniref:Cytochrome C oxidase subunit II n=1 Tax=Allobacillus halotolerans TaxID=570278 RepID=A0ABS6GRI3_9BACI|nr:cytochrome C oxidase subunit II [Allobacillus halotolerans]